jgi:toxin ParE1/3/4
MTYRFSESALIDLENIWAYTCKQWSIKQADKYVQLIFTELEFLTNNPNVGKDYGHIRSGYLGFKISAHICFYQINIDENFILIVRILHQRMDISNRLLD